MVCALLCTGPNLSAQSFPSKAITIVVPYAPGATDREARKIAELAAKHLGQSVVVENRDGASCLTWRGLMRDSGGRARPWQAPERDSAIGTPGC